VRIVIWLNIYDPETMRLPDVSWTREQADAKAAAHRIECIELHMRFGYDT